MSNKAVRIKTEKTDPANGRKVDGVKSAFRVLSVIKFLTTESSGATFSEICLALDFPKSSAHALLGTMVDQGFLVLDPNSHQYRIGVRIWEAGQAYATSFDLPGIAMPYLEAASEALHETVQLATLDGIENVYVAKVEADQRLVLRSNVGSRLPAYATGLGKVLLSGLDDDELRRRFDGVKFQRFTERSITDFAKLYEVIQQVRRDGFGVDNGEYTSGVFCVAVPVRDHSGRVISAMSVSVPEVRSTSASRPRASEVLLEQADALSRRLGHVTSAPVRKTSRPRKGSR